VDGAVEVYECGVPVCLCVIEDTLDACLICLTFPGSCERRFPVS
jgi:hypothetical protein